MSCFVTLSEKNLPYLKANPGFIKTLAPYAWQVQHVYSTLVINDSLSRLHFKPRVYYKVTFLTSTQTLQMPYKEEHEEQTFIASVKSFSVHVFSLLLL